MPNPPSTQSVCPTCGSDDPSELFNMLDRGRSYDAGISGCPDPFHDPDTQTEERCGGDGWIWPKGALCEVPCPGCLNCQPAPPDPRGQVEEERCEWAAGECDQYRAALDDAYDFIDARGLHDDFMEFINEPTMPTATARARVEVAESLATSYRQGLEQIEQENRKRAWFFPRWFRDVTLAKWTADTARSLLNPSSTSEGER